MVIENETAYEAGKQRAIKRNATKSRAERWFKENSDAQEISDWLNESGEFAMTWVTKDPADQEAYDARVAEEWSYANKNDCDPYHEIDQLDVLYDTRRTVSPMVEGMFASDFGQLLLNIRDSLWEYGGLSFKQTDIVRKALARKRQWVAEADQRKAERLTEKAKSVWVGDLKQRMVFDLTVNKVLDFDGQWGMTYINLCEDADGNQIVCKGTKRLPLGHHKVKATVKAHEEREGIKQTMINRPVVEG